VSDTTGDAQRKRAENKNIFINKKNSAKGKRLTKPPFREVWRALC
jgi:hypothetical protein